MRKILSPIFVLLGAVLLPGSSSAAAGLICDHALYGAPFATVELTLAENGALEPGARITVYGKSHVESVTEEAKAPGELYHLWLSKENDANSIEMIVNEPAANVIKAKLINDRVPIGKEILGICRWRPSP